MNIQTAESDFDNYLPHNFLAEKMVLSCMLTNSEAIEYIIKNVNIESFYFKNHQELFKVVLFMYKNKISVDVTTLTTFLQENGLLSKIGGVKVLIELIDQIPNLVYLDEYIRLIKDKFLRRSLIKLGYKTINSSYVTNLSLENILNDFENQLFNLTNDFKPTKLYSSTDLVYSIFLELKEKATYPNLPGLSSGFYAFDSLTQGFQKSDLIIVAGRPSIGKTAFSLTISLNIIKYSKLPVVVFSLEMSKEQIMYRLLSMESNVSQSRLRSGKLYKTDWTKLNKIIKLLSKLPLFVDDSSALSVQEIRAKIKTILFQYPTIGLVIIDYLQLMQTSIPNNGNRAQELSQITRALKNLAREFNIPVIALSQLSRNVETRIDKKPILSDLRESGSIEQDADLVVMLYQNEPSKPDLSTDNLNKVIDLIIAKQRNGPIGNIQLRFDKKRTKYLDM
jgi:replicative DNA helicase